MAYYYLDQPFQTGMVLDRLSAAGYTQFVAMDIGGGESSAYLYEYKNLQWQIRKLKFDDKDSPTIPTYISYSGGQVRIGRQADPLRFISRFKLPPDKWEKAKPDGSHTAKELLRDFIAQFWKDILHWTPELRRSAEDGGLMLVVGCPASGEWLASAGDYEQMIREATGCPGVSVVSEAVAAMVHEVFTGHLDLSQGVVIYDVGSITVDAVYLCLGKKLISKSLPLGGSQIDQGMLLRILEGSGISREDIPYDQWQYILAQVRAIKEDYYPGKCVRERNIYLLKTDGTSGLTIQKPEKISETGGPGAGRDVWLPGPPDRVLQVRMDDAFMEKVLKEDKNLVDYPDQTWLEVLEDLFRDVRTRIGDRPCQTVILTGGTSHIPEILDLARAVYDGKVSRVIQSEEPSAAVAQGLCMAKGRESRALQDLEACQKQLEESAQARFKDLLFAFKKYIYGSMDELIRSTAQSYVGKASLPAISQFAAQVKAKAVKDGRFTGAQMEDILAKTFAENIGSYCSKVEDTVSGLSEAIYGKRLGIALDTASGHCPAIDQAYMQVLDFDSYLCMMLANDDIPTCAGIAYLPLALILAVIPFNPRKDAEYDGSEEALYRYASRVGAHVESVYEAVMLAQAKNARKKMSCQRLKELLHYGTDSDPREKLSDKLSNFEWISAWKISRKSKKKEESFDDFLKRASSIEEYFNAQIRDLFEIALGQILFLVFEEPADLYEERL